MRFCSCIIHWELQDTGDRLFWQESIYAALEIVFIYLSDSSQLVVVPGSIAHFFHSLLVASIFPSRHPNTYGGTSAHHYTCPANTHTSTSPT
jgi:hypothetical protein